MVPYRLHDFVCPIFLGVIENSRTNQRNNSVVRICDCKK